MNVGEMDMDLAREIYEQEDGDLTRFIRRMIDEYTFTTDQIITMVMNVASRDRSKAACVVESVLSRMPQQAVTATDCRSDEGVTVGILDSIITMCRLYKGREVTPAVREALRDLATDEDFAKLLADIQSS